ncbi:hypothetical protein BN1356_01750 [Streptococcus varani]|uniref:MAE-28990/MAE-18760-like HEPN domain-containing protein n=1 Tax=Streptococcus varani TaxID=1608583 RepID=A0A0E4H4Y9_9STRE|nr:hypothetical protein BN1356_01750 [Streptococcus varani]
MIQNTLNSEYKIEIEKESFHLSGNADVQEIKNILKIHGVSYDDNIFGDYGGALLTIKTQRNRLAHGNVSFEENGRGFSISQIIGFKEKTYECLEYFVSLVEQEYC